MSAPDLARVEAVAARWMAACEGGNPAAIAGCLGDGATVWYNFAPDRTHDRAAYQAILADSATRFRQPRYTEVRLHYHPGGFVEQATLAGDTDAGLIETPFLLIATVEGDSIVAIAQYFDTTILRQHGIVAS